MIIILLLQLANVQYGLASVYNDKVFACPKSTYKNNKLPTCASRTLPCGTVVTVKRLDNGKVALGRVIDRGGFGVCVPSTKNSRACGQGLKWKNGRNYFKYNLPMGLATWRGILDMSPALAHKLGAKNRLVPVVIYTGTANNEPSVVNPDIIDDPKIQRNIDNSNVFAYLE